MFRPNCHWSLPRLPWPNRLGSSQPDEPADAGALPERRAEVDVAGALLLDPEDDVDVVRRLGAATTSGGGHRLLEESQVGDVLIGADQRDPG